MSDCIIDTNVLLVASAHHPGSPFEDSDVPARHMQVVLDWLMAFRKDSQSKIVLDDFWEIWKEYHHKMTGQDIGLIVVAEKLQSARFVGVEYDEHGHGRLSETLELVVHDRSDRKFVAAAHIDRRNGDQSRIVNAVDSDWCAWESALKAEGIDVEHLIGDLCDDPDPPQPVRRSAPKRRTRSKR